MEFVVRYKVSIVSDFSASSHLVMIPQDTALDGVPECAQSA